MGLVAVAALGACGSGGGVSGPKVRDSTDLAARISKAGLGCKDVVVAPGSEEGVIDIGYCSILHAGPEKRAKAERLTTWCETEPPLPPRRWRCEIGANPSARTSGGLAGSLGFWVYESADAASEGTATLAGIQCRARPDPSVALYQVKGPNWIAPSLDYDIARVVGGALDATVSDLDC
ncbi:MAG: hypothetical protein FJW88_08635 [Actinobacteria bacterium]|nr:hypothetical protein [Actinomycetota bacterium]